MIRHCVMLHLRDDADLSELQTVFDALGALVDRLEGCSDFVAGPNRDYEGKSADYAFGFTLDADTETALAAYAAHPEHQALGARLVAQCQNGARGIVVYDIEAAA